MYRISINETNETKSPTEIWRAILAAFCLFFVTWFLTVNCQIDVTKVGLFFSITKWKIFFSNSWKQSLLYGRVTSQKVTQLRIVSYHYLHLHFLPYNYYFWNLSTEPMLCNGFYLWMIYYFFTQNARIKSNT